MINDHVNAKIKVERFSLMKKIIPIVLLSISFISGCQARAIHTSKHPTDILGNPNCLAFSYGGYREKNRDTVPSVAELKEDMKILHAMGVRLIRTYNTQQYAQTHRLMQAIRALKKEDPAFEMYVMLGAWIDCKGAWTTNLNHQEGDEVNNSAEVNAAVRMANEYQDIVKVIAVGNEAMVHWATSYFVHPRVILKWVTSLQNLKLKGDLPADIWITSSDNFASWGGGDKSYHNPDLVQLIKAVDYISIHIYPFHDSHYNPVFWGVPEAEESLANKEIIEAAMVRAKDYAMSQYENTAHYIASLGVTKPIHIGETGWATQAHSFYGDNGSRAADEYKQKLYYDDLRAWTQEARIACFFFEIFDEQWKDMGNIEGSENHFGLINLKSQAKYALWHLVDKGAFTGLTRMGMPITKTYDGKLDAAGNNWLASCPVPKASFCPNGILSSMAVL